MDVVSENRRPKLNLFTLASIAAGVYVGYQEGKGVDMSLSKEYLLKYGPTTMATVFPLFFLGLTKFGARRTLNMLSNNYAAGTMEITMNKGVKKRYSDLSSEEKEKIDPKMEEMKTSLEKLLTNTNCLNSALTAGTTTAVHTTWGYLTGRAFSQIF